jgi:hypothetical protein
VLPEPRQTQTLISPKLVEIFKDDYRVDTAPPELDTSFIVYLMAFHLTNGVVRKTLFVSIALNNADGPIADPHVSYVVEDAHIDLMSSWASLVTHRHNSFLGLDRKLYGYGICDFTAQHLYESIRSASVDDVPNRYIHRPLEGRKLTRLLTAEEFVSVTNCISAHLASAEMGDAE